MSTSTSTSIARAAAQLDTNKCSADASPSPPGNNEGTQLKSNKQKPKPKENMSMSTSHHDVSPMNQFDSPKSPEQEEAILISEGINNNFIINMDDDTMNIEVGVRENDNDSGNDVGDDDALSETKRRLDDIFLNESYSQHVEMDELELGNMQQQQQLDFPNQEQALTENKHCQEGTEENRIAMLSEQSIQWDENDNFSRSGSYDPDNDNGNDNDGKTKDDDHEQTYLKNRYCCCFLRIIHCTCQPRIHPPCISNISHPHLPKCLERISPRVRRLTCRSLIIIFMIITISFVCLDLLILHQYLHIWLNSTLAWLSSNPVSGGVVFIGIFLAASLCFFPIGLVSMGAGYVYIGLYGLGLGILVAFVVCYFGCLLGAAVCFARSRYLMRVLVERFSIKYPIVRAVDRSFETMGLRLFLLLRLSPAMPFNALNYIGGITAISFRNYWWATVIGIAPGLLWTIFIGATFGTVDARGVDGKKEWDQSSLRKGVVLGLGIILGVMGIVGTGIYARKELTKIIIAEQRQRALEEEVGTEMPQHLMNGECEANTGVGGDNPLPFEDLDNPQPSESIGAFFGDNESVASHCSDSSSPPAENTPRKMKQRSWTPKAVAAELPILPRVLHRVLTPIISFESMIPPDQPTPDCEANADNSTVVTPVDSSSKRTNNKRLASSMPPLADTDNFSFILENEKQDEGYNTTEEESSPFTRRHSAPMNDDTMTGLANIDETKVLTDDDKAPKISSQQTGEHQMMTPVLDIKRSNRRRCSTDPTDRREHRRAFEDDEEKVLGTTASHRQRRQQSQFWTPSKQGLRKRFNSFGSFGNWQTPLRQPPLSDSAAKSDRVPSAASPSLHQTRQQQQNRERSSSLPLQFSPSHNHLELMVGNIDSNEDDDNGPSREWFWIWA